jgi:hypothetical protein
MCNPASWILTIYSGVVQLFFPRAKEPIETQLLLN